MRKLKFGFFIICLAGCLGWSLFLCYLLLAAYLGNGMVLFDFNSYHENLTELITLSIFSVGGIVGLFTIRRNPWTK